MRTNKFVVSVEKVDSQSYLANGICIDHNSQRSNWQQQQQQACLNNIDTVKRLHANS